jgi:hypothetical protein
MKKMTEREKIAFVKRHLTIAYTDEGCGGTEAGCVLCHMIDVLYTLYKGEIMMKEGEKFPIDLNFWLNFNSEGVGKDDIRVVLDNGYSIDEILTHIKKKIEELMKE